MGEAPSPAGSIREMVNRPGPSSSLYLRTRGRLPSGAWARRPEFGTAEVIPAATGMRTTTSFHRIAVLLGDGARRTGRLPSGRGPYDTRRLATSGRLHPTG